MTNRETKSKYSDFIEALYKGTETLQRGDLLTHARIEEALGVARTEKIYYYLVNQWRKLLLERRSIACLPEMGEGWRLQTHQGHLQDIPAYRNKKQSNQIKYTERDLDAIKTEDLSDHDRRVFNSLKKSLKDQQRQLDKAKETLFVLYSPTKK